MDSLLKDVDVILVATSQHPRWVAPDPSLKTLRPKSGGTFFVRVSKGEAHGEVAPFIYFSGVASVCIPKTLMTHHEKFSFPPRSINHFPVAFKGHENSLRRPHSWKLYLLKSGVGILYILLKVSVSNSTCQEVVGSSSPFRVVLVPLGSRRVGAFVVSRSVSQSIGKAIAYVSLDNIAEMWGDLGVLELMMMMLMKTKRRCVSLLMVHISPIFALYLLRGTFLPSAVLPPKLIQSWPPRSVNSRCVTAHISERGPRIQSGFCEVQIFSWSNLFCNAAKLSWLLG